MCFPERYVHEIPENTNFMRSANAQQEYREFFRLFARV